MWDTFPWWTENVSLQDWLYNAAQQPLLPIFQIVLKSNFLCGRIALVVHHFILSIRFLEVSSWNLGRSFTLNVVISRWKTSEERFTFSCQKAPVWLLCPLPALSPQEGRENLKIYAGSWRKATESSQLRATRHSRHGLHASSAPACKGSPATPCPSRHAASQPPSRPRPTAAPPRTRRRGAGLHFPSCARGSGKGARHGGGRGAAARPPGRAGAGARRQQGDPAEEHQAAGGRAARRLGAARRAGRRRLPQVRMRTPHRVGEVGRGPLPPAGSVPAGCCAHGRLNEVIVRSEAGARFVAKCVKLRQQPLVT